MAVSKETEVKKNGEQKSNAALEAEIGDLLERIKVLEGKKESAGKAKSAQACESAKSVEEALNKKVKVKLFRDGKDYKDDVFVGINGVSYQIKRGIEVEIPLKVAQLLDRAQIQSIKAAELIDEKVKEFAARNI